MNDLLLNLGEVGEKEEQKGGIIRNSNATSSNTTSLFPPEFESATNNSNFKRSATTIIKSKTETSSKNANLKNSYHRESLASQCNEETNIVPSTYFSSSLTLTSSSPTPSTVSSITTGESPFGSIPLYLAKQIFSSPTSTNLSYTTIQSESEAGDFGNQGNNKINLEENNHIDYINENQELEVSSTEIKHCRNNSIDEEGTTVLGFIQNFNGRSHNVQVQGLLGCSLQQQQQYQQQQQPLALGDGDEQSRSRAHTAPAIFHAPDFTGFTDSHQEVHEAGQGKDFSTQLQGILSTSQPTKRGPEAIDETSKPKLSHRTSSEDESMSTPLARLMNPRQDVSLSSTFSYKASNVVNRNKGNSGKSGNSTLVNGNKGNRSRAGSITINTSKKSTNAKVSSKKSEPLFELRGSAKKKTRARSMSLSSTLTTDSTGTASGNGKRCKFEGCTKHSQGNTPFCIGHGGGRRCTVPGCTKGARDQFFCCAHGGGKRCIEPGCNKSAVGPTNKCCVHGGGRRCKHINPEDGTACDKSAQSSTDFCVRHGGGRKCQIMFCEKVARGRLRLCANHAKDVQDIIEEPRWKQNLGVNSTLHEKQIQIIQYLNNKANEEHAIESKSNNNYNNNDNSNNNNSKNSFSNAKCLPTRRGSNSTKQKNKNTNTNTHDIVTNAATMSISLSGTGSLTTTTKNNNNNTSKKGSKNKNNYDNTRGENSFLTESQNKANSTGKFSALPPNLVIKNNDFSDSEMNSELPTELSTNSYLNNSISSKDLDNLFTNYIPPSRLEIETINSNKSNQNQQTNQQANQIDGVDYSVAQTYPDIGSNINMGMADFTGMNFAPTSYLGVETTNNTAISYPFPLQPLQNIQTSQHVHHLQQDLNHLQLDSSGNSNLRSQELLSDFVRNQTRSSLPLPLLGVFSSPTQPDVLTTRLPHNEEEDKNPQDSTLLRLEDLSMETEQHLPRDTGKQNMSVGANITFEEFANMNGANMNYDHFGLYSPNSLK